MMNTKLLNRLAVNNQFLLLTDLELNKLRCKFKPTGVTGKNIKRKIDVAADYRWPLAAFDKKAFPLTEEPDMVRCIHEGLCPTCGRKAHLTSEVALWARVNGCDWDVWNAECLEGHKHTAEPNESGTDWVAW